MRSRLSRPALVAAAAGLLTAALAAPAATAAPGAASTSAAAAAAAALPAGPFLSEVHYDNDGADTGEFVEVQVPAGTALTGWSVALYNGNGATAYAPHPLPSTTAPASGPVAVAVDAPGIQNGSPDGFALVDPSGAATEFLSYEGTFTAVGGPAAGLASTDLGVAEATTTPLGQSLFRVVVDGSLVWQGPAAATRGTVNTAPAPPPPAATCDATPTRTIGAVQGTGAATPLAGQTVVVRGTVVADTPGLDGFSLQDAGDGDPASSDGVFVLSPGTDVALGQTVQVSGQAQESFGQTRIASPSGVAVCDVPTVALPAAAALDLPADAAARERLEGELVRPVDALSVSEVFGLTSFGELVLSEGGVLVQPTELARPGPDAAAIATANARRRIVLDDASNASPTRPPPT